VIIEFSWIAYIDTAFSGAVFKEIIVIVKLVSAVNTSGYIQWQDFPFGSPGAAVSPMTIHLFLSFLLSLNPSPTSSLIHSSNKFSLFCLLNICVFCPSCLYSLPSHICLFPTFPPKSVLWSHTIFHAEYIFKENANLFVFLCSCA
jgi:hypothetical protein